MIKNFQNTGYRLDIDVLRFIAVTGVVFYHAGLGLTRDFVSVAVFLLTSGFLITGILLRKLQDDNVTPTS